MNCSLTLIDLIKAADYDHQPTRRRKLRAGDLFCYRCGIYRPNCRCHEFKNMLDIVYREK